MANPKVSPAEVIGLADDQLKQAGLLYTRSRRIQLGTLTLGILSIFIKNSYAYIPALLALASQTCSWHLRNKAGGCHSIGEEGRMHGLLIDALGWTGERVDLANWFSHASPRTGRSTPAPAASNYFASKSPVGLRRLCDHLQENAFWGKHLYKATAAFYERLLWAVGIALIVAVLVSIPLASGDQGFVFARILVAVLASGALATQLGEVRSWKSAEAKSDTLDRRLEVISKISDKELKSDSIGALLSVYGDYRVATASAPPAPFFMYHRERDRLNQLWERQSR